MTPEHLAQIQKYVNTHVDEFHNRRIASLKRLELMTVLEKKNPYMFRTKDVRTPQELVESILQAHLSSSEETQFGNFLEDLAVFCLEVFNGGYKVPGTGLDMMFSRDGIHYLVAVKSGNNWGNSSQHARLKENFKHAVRLMRQNKDVHQVQPVLGICYGKAEQQNADEYVKFCGQAFWEFVSGDPNLYMDIVEPLGYEAALHNERFRDEYAATLTRFTLALTQEFYEDGHINWEKLVKFNSGRRESKAKAKPSMKDKP
jgi:hypothetical protein